MASEWLLFDDRGWSIVLERAVCDGRVATVVDIYCSFNEVARKKEKKKESEFAFHWKGSGRNSLPKTCMPRILLTSHENIIAYSLLLLNHEL